MYRCPTRTRWLILAGVLVSTVAPPVGATVPYLPEDAKKETVNGKRYFSFEGAYYQPFASDGDTIYMVVSDPTEAEPAS